MPVLLISVEHAFFGCICLRLCFEVLLCAYLQSSLLTVSAVSATVASSCPQHAVETVFVIVLLATAGLVGIVVIVLVVVLWSLYVAVDPLHALPPPTQTTRQY